MHELSKNETLLNECYSKLEQLKSICELPKLYLSNHFEVLRAEIDLYFIQEINKPNATPTEIVASKADWKAVIDRAQSFEHECYDSLNDVAVKLVEENLEEIEKNDLASSQPAMDKLEFEEFRIQKTLFNGQTLFFFDPAKCKTHFYILNQPAKAMLVIIRNEFISPQGIEYTFCS